ncbi:hypothetical protein QBC35DRAFT_485414 [Podospora australis]|uniref:Uncharacterized protein n=1 Tax=Podospora australis TaxID=1536484 RepID=A0AAN6X190_9PEZI|nr:hypothetical protein QBC35DRAFT_485414 [Podospora australis]
MLSSSAPSSHRPAPLNLSGHHHHSSQSAGSGSSPTQNGTPGTNATMSSPGSPQSAGSEKNYFHWPNSTHEEPEEYAYHQDSTPTPSRSGTTSTTSPLLIGRGRAVSDSSAASVGHHQNKMAHRSQKKVNAHSYCGRHSSEFLFGGRGLGDVWRAVKPKGGKKE